MYFSDDRAQSMIRACTRPTCNLCVRFCFFWLSLSLSKNTLRLTLALTTTSRPANQACLHRWDPLIWVLLPVELFDLCRLDESHVTAAAALLAPAALPPMLAEAAAPTVLAHAALPPVLADATAAAVLALAALPPVLAEAATAALLALAARPPVMSDTKVWLVAANSAFSHRHPSRHVNPAGWPSTVLLQGSSGRIRPCSHILLPGAPHVSLSAAAFAAFAAAAASLFAAFAAAAASLFAAAAAAFFSDISSASNRRLVW